MGSTQVFINQTLINPHYLHSKKRANGPDHSDTLDAALTRLCQSGDYPPGIS